MELQTTKRSTRRVVLYGAQGRMKTMAALKFPKPLVVQDSVTLGADLLDCPRLTLRTATEFAEVVEQMRKGGYGTLVLDDFSSSMERFASVLADGWAKERKRALDNDYMRAVDKVNDVIMPTMRALLCAPWNLVITCHAKQDKEVIPVEPYERAVMRTNLAPALERMLLGSFDLVGYCFRSAEGKVMVQTSETATRTYAIRAKRRVGINVPDLIGMGDDGSGVAKALGLVVGG